MAFPVLVEAGLCLASLINGFKSSAVSSKVRLLPSCILVAGAALAYRLLSQSITRLHLGIFLGVYSFSYLAGSAIVCIGLTGGIACGKSAVVEVLRKNFPEVLVIDCDRVVRDLQRPGKPVFNRIVETFGKEMVNTEGELDRPKLAKLIFSDSVARQKINAITHPAVSREILKQVFSGRLHGYRHIVLDAPLLFEAKVFPYFCHPIITVQVSDQELWLQRLMVRDNITREDALAKIRSQMPIERKVALSHYVIDNTGSLDNLRDTVQRVFTQVVRS
jgi:dephospho-CoA kinase